MTRDIALYSAVEMDEDTTRNMLRVPFIYRDSQLLEWWVRFLLSSQSAIGTKRVSLDSLEGRAGLNSTLRASDASRWRSEVLPRYQLRLAISISTEPQSGQAGSRCS